MKKVIFLQIKYSLMFIRRYFVLKVDIFLNLPNVPLFLIIQSLRRIQLSNIIMLILSKIPLLNHEFDEPLKHSINFIQVHSLDLMRGNVLRTMEIRKHLYNFFSYFYFLTQLHFVIVLNVYINVGVGYAPCQSTYYLV